ncbi:hypothetical protein Dimus_009861, partial [Dionaea muscipula]
VLIIVLNGKKDDSDDGHISMYLKLVDKLKPNEAINAVFRFLVYNQKMDNYLVKQDMTGKHFSLLKMEWGLDDDSKLAIGGGRVFVEYEITLKDQLGSNDEKLRDTSWFQSDEKAAASRGTEDQPSLFFSINLGVVRYQPPAHYILGIESLSSVRSSLAKFGDGRISSSEFSACGHKWVLIVDLNGKDNDKDGHISMYLKLIDKLEPEEDVRAVFSFFVYNQKLHNYFTKQDMIGKRFRGLKTEWGIAKVLSLSTFNDPTKGYVICDYCEFGTEVFVRKSADFQMGTLSLVTRANVSRQYCWRVSDYSKLDGKCESRPFTFDGISWTLLMYPRGNAQEQGKSISVYLSLDDDSKLSIGGKRIFAEYDITLKDGLGSKDIKKSFMVWFHADVVDWGFSAFLPLSDLSKRYLRKDELIIEVDMKTMIRLEDAKLDIGDDD